MATLTPESLRALTEDYFAGLSDGEARGGPSAYLAHVGLDMATARMLCGPHGDPDAAEVLRDAATRLRAHMETAGAWSGGNGAKAQFLLRVPMWDGEAYRDRGAPTMTGSIDVTWGGNEDDFD